MTQQFLSFSVERESMPVPNPEAFVYCPNCNHSVASNCWMHPKCPKCKHCNAIIGGVCRDCGFEDKRLDAKVEYVCNACEWVFRV